MKEMFTKDLQEPKNKETEMNYMLEGINSTITDAEEQISDLEHRMEITAAELNKKKEWKEMKTAWETSGTTLNTPTFAL